MAIVPPAARWQDSMEQVPSFLKYNHKGSYIKYDPTWGHDSTLPNAQMPNTQITRVLCPCRRPWSINCQLPPQARAKVARAKGSRKSKHDQYPDTLTVKCVRDGCNGSTLSPTQARLTWTKGGRDFLRSNIGDQPCAGAMCSCYQNDRIKEQRMDRSNGNPFACEEDPFNAQPCCYWLQPIEYRERRLTADLKLNLTPEPVARERQMTPLDSKRARTPLYHES